MVCFLVRVATLGAVVLAMAGPAASADSNNNSPLNHLDGADLIDLLDAELDESFLTKGFRNLQQFEMTGSPTPSPTAGSRELETAAPTTGDFPTASPSVAEFTTASPTAAMGSTNAPTMMATETPGPTVSPTTSGAVGSWRPASAVALALTAVAAAVLA